jgi:uncharacterized membrane protein YeiH
VVFVVLSYYYGVDTNTSAWISIAATLLLRLLAIRFNWATRSLREWRRRNDEPQ